jgi:excinuclease ABC subunit A
MLYDESPMTENINSCLAQSRWTDPGRYLDLFVDMPGTVPGVCALVQGLLLPAFDLALYGLGNPEEERRDIESRAVPQLLANILAVDRRALAMKRPPGLRLGAGCHQAALLTCSLLRHAGIPARVREGFANYLGPDLFVGHSLCEVWHAKAARWLRIDTQIDDIQRRDKGIGFQPLDVPAEAFVTGAEMWRPCRNGSFPTDRVQAGLGFVRNLLLLDLLALNGLETHRHAPLLMRGYDEMPTADEAVFLDGVADTIITRQASPEAMRVLYESDARLQIPSDARP